jgi:hypothetical protein
MTTPGVANPSVTLTFTQDGPNTLKTASSGAGSCSLELVVSGQTATLAQPHQTCTDQYGGVVEFTAYNLVAGPAAGTTDGGMASDAGVSADASSSQGGGATLTWHLEDNISNICVTTLDLTLARKH